MWRVSEDDLANYLKPVDNETQERVAAGTLGLAREQHHYFLARQQRLQHVRPGLGVANSLLKS